MYKIQQAGFIHRDLKPANLFWDRASDTVRVGDWEHAWYV